MRGRLEVPGNGRVRAKQRSVRCEVVSATRMCGEVKEGLELMRDYNNGFPDLEPEQVTIIAQGTCERLVGCSRKVQRAQTAGASRTRGAGRLRFRHSCGNYNAGGELRSVIVPRPMLVPSLDDQVKRDCEDLEIDVAV